jgi:hypothetical protein
LPSSLTAKHIDAIFAAHDAHGNDAQVAAFMQHLEDEHGIDVASFEPTLRRHPAVIG